MDLIVSMDTNKIPVNCCKIRANLERETLQTASESEARSLMSSERATPRTSSVDRSETTLKTSVVPSPTTLRTLRDTGVYDGEL